MEFTVAAVSAAVSGVIAIVALVVGHALGQRQAEQDRLRALYADVLKAAIRCTPRSLGYRVGPDETLPTPDEINVLRGRLGVETHEDGDAVLGGLVGAYNWSDTYRSTVERTKAHPGSVPPDELPKLEKLIRDSINGTQSAARERLAAAERLIDIRWPTIERPRRPTGWHPLMRAVAVAAALAAVAIFAYFFWIGLTFQLECQALSPYERFHAPGCPWP